MYLLISLYVSSNITPTKSQNLFCLDLAYVDIVYIDQDYVDLV